MTKGNFIYDLHIGLHITNNEHLKGYDWSYSYTKDDGSKINHHKENPLTKRSYSLSKKEKEVAYVIVGRT
jgi:hypothetical protein